MPSSHCLGCQLPMVRGEGAEVPEGWVQHKARGMCGICRMRILREGRLEEFPRDRRPSRETAEMWEMLQMLGYTKAEGAQKLGMSANALNRALQRARSSASKSIEPVETAVAQLLGQAA